MAAKKATKVGKISKKRPPRVKKPVRGKAVKKGAAKSPGKTVAKGKPATKTKQLSKSPTTKSPKKQVLAKSKAKPQVKSQVRGKQTKTTANSAKKSPLQITKKVTKSPIKVTVGVKVRGRSPRVLSVKSSVKSPVKTGKAVKKLPARSPAKVGRPPKTASKPTPKVGRPPKQAKTISKSPVKSLDNSGRSPVKSPARSSPSKMATPPSRFYQKTTNRSPVKLPQSPVSGIRPLSPRGPTTTTPVKGKGPVKRSPVKASPKPAGVTGPAHRVQIKLSPKGLPAKPSLKSPRSASKYSVMVVKKSPTTSPVQTGSMKRGSPVKRTLLGRPPSSPKKAGLKSPAKGPASPKKAVAVKASKVAQIKPKTIITPKKDSPLTRSPRRLPVTSTEQSQARTPTRGRSSETESKPSGRSPAKKGDKDLGRTAQTRGQPPAKVQEPPERATRKRPVNNADTSPAKKLKTDEKSGKVERSRRSSQAASLSPTRPTRTISKPARYLDEEPEQKNRPKAAVAIQMPKSPPKPTRVVNIKSINIKPKSPSAKPDQSAKDKKSEDGEGKKAAHPCKFCGLLYRTEKDVVMHQNRCDKNTEVVKRTEVVQGTAQPKKPSSPLRSPMVLNIPTGKNINDVIKQAIQAATKAGLVAPNKQVVVRGPNVQETKVVTKETPAKQMEKTPVAPSPKRQTPQAVATVRKVIDSKKARVGRPGSRVAVVSPEPKKPIVHTPSVKEMLAKDGKDSDPKFFTCLDCGNCFPSRKEVSEHKKSCSGVGKSMVNACMDCNATFQTRGELNAHRKENHNSTRSTKKSSTLTVRGYRCSVCNVFYPDSQELKNHIAEIHKGQAQGSMCNVVATPDSVNPGNWNNSISEEMVEEVIKNLVNGVSNRIQPGTSDVENASSSSASPTKASSTSGATSKDASPSAASASSDSSPSSAATYRDSRTPGQCLDCFMKVNSRLELAKHKRQCKIALQNRQMFCFECGKPFKSYKELAAHKQAMHGPSAQFLKCSPCNISFKSNIEWQEHHQQVHGGNIKARTLKRKRVSFAPEASESAQINTATEEPKTSDEANILVDLTNDGLEEGDAPEVFPETSMSSESTYSPAKPSSSSPRVQKRAIGTIQYLQPDDVSGKKKKKEAPKSRQDKVAEDSEMVKVLPAGSGGGKDDTPASISLANGLVTISADKANDYQIFVDAKQDGSSIQVKLVRNDDVARLSAQEKAATTTTPTTTTTPSPTPTTTTTTESSSRPSRRVTKTNATPAERRRTSPRKASPSPAKPAPTPTQSGLVSKGILKGVKSRRSTPVAASVKAVQEKTPVVNEAPARMISARTNVVLKKPIQGKAPTPVKFASVRTVPVRAAKAAPAKGKTAPAKGKEKEKEKDIGMVVQKGKPFVIGGQTMVPIQFPPGFQLPGGNSGGQKVFAIPSTNLPPGLLQLMGKQNKGGATTVPTTATKPTVEKQQASTSSSTASSSSGSSSSGSSSSGSSSYSRKKPSLEIAAVADPSAIPAPATTSPLKGMTGAQLMARAQAKILGRPIRANQAPSSSSAPPAAQPKAATSGRVKQPASSSPKQGPSKPAPVKQIPAKQASPLKRIAPKPMPPLSPTRKPHVEQLSSGYRDPLFVYQCTNCNKTFKSTGDVKVHMINGCAGSERNQRPKRRKLEQEEGTGVWHIKPVAPDQDEDDVEWFVASNEGM